MLTRFFLLVSPSLLRSLVHCTHLTHELCAVLCAVNIMCSRTLQDIVELLVSDVPRLDADRVDADLAKVFGRSCLEQ
jgi:hypothetical protein